MNGITDAQIDEVMARYAELMDAEVKRASLEQWGGWEAADACRDIFRRSWMALGKAARDVKGAD